MTHGLPGDPGAAAPEVTVLSSREVYRTPWIGVREDRIVQHGVPLTFSVIEMKAGVTVLPLDDAGQVHLVSEYKYGIGRQSLELVSGGVEAEEDLLDAARRELVEETGLLASEWEYLGRLDPFTTAVHAPNHLFLATGLSSTSPRPEAGEVLTLVRLGLADVLEEVMRGAVTHAATCVLVLKVARLLRLEHA